MRVPILLLMLRKQEPKRFRFARIAFSNGLFLRYSLLHLLLRLILYLILMILYIISKFCAT